MIYKQWCLQIYLHCPSFSTFLQNPAAMTFLFNSDTEKHLKLGSSPADERSLFPSFDSRVDELSDDPDDDVSSEIAIFKLGI